MGNHAQSQHASRPFRLAAILAASLLSALGLWASGAGAKGGDDEHDNESPIQWVNHFALLPGGSEITTSFNSTNSGIGGGLTGLVIESSTVGDTFTPAGNKVVHMALELKKNTHIRGVRVCYESTDAGTYIDQIRLAQVQDPPASALVLLDDATHLTNPGPICVDSAKTFIKSSDGSVLLSLRVWFGDVQDAIVVRALGLYVN
jgi:hypothetical protein